MNDVKKQLALLRIQADLALIALEKEMDQLQQSTKRLTMILHFLLIVIILISLIGYLALQFPKPFSNYWTLLAAKMGTFWATMLALTKILEIWKIGQESNRSWKLEIKKRKDREQQLEEDELIRRKMELQRERIVN